MSIKLYKSGDHSLDSANVANITNVRHDAKISVLEKEKPNADRLLPHFFSAEKGDPVISTVLGPGVVYLTEGEFHFEDTARPGEPTIATPGDVVLLETGTVLKTSTPSVAKGFAVTYAPASATILDYFQL